MSGAASRVLVTGATTGAGAALVDALLADPGTERVVAVSFDSSCRHLPWDVRLTCASVDLSRPRAVTELLAGPARRLGVTAVVHAPLRRSLSDGGPATRALTVGVTRALLDACDGHPTIQRLVYVGTAAVYGDEPSTPRRRDERCPLAFGAQPGWRRDRVEADLAVCCRMGSSSTTLVVLRQAELLAPGCGSPLWDYLQAPVCLRPLGFDPMLELLSLADATAATRRALAADAGGVFNVGGADVLPLSRLLRLAGRRALPLPGPALGPLYRARARMRHGEFRYDLYAARLHVGALLDGARARRLLGYAPAHPLRWPPW